MTTTTPLSPHQACTVLRWDGSESRIAEDLLSRSIERVCTALVQRVALADQAHVPGADSALADLAALTGPQLMTIGAAPLTFAQLSGANVGGADVESLVRYVRRAARAEQHLAASDGAPLWTALGDREVSAGFQAPRVQGIPVDYCSPRAAEVQREGGVAAPLYREVERGRVTSALDDAMDVLHRTVPAAHALVGQFSRVVVALPDPVRTVPHSASAPAVPGEVVLWNAHTASRAQLVDMLVHESIHGLFYSLQLLQPYLLDSRRLSALQVVSPWSQRPLPGDSFVDACFVWYGLWELWSRWPASADDADAAGLATRAAGGFRRSGRLLDLLGDADPAISPEATFAIDTIQQTVLDRSPLH